ncbi:MAG: carbohydrate binding family 9 domain-containing protein [Bacteroidetes bacterium]|jgi:hypothetical protein|nr:carbohydrate binding family 9 domain-containing protein [Bacteroidota bacterium]
MPKLYNLFILVVFLHSNIFLGQKKTLQSIRTTEKITIDGLLDEAIWKIAPIATDFVMINPGNGTPIPNRQKTDVKIVYDNEAVYVAATLYDDEPSKILKELTLRDDFATADHFGVFFNGYNDGQHEFRFFVSAAGVQQDGLYTDALGEDFSWDAIWKSEVKITDFGWVVEMKIPYAALRFPNSAVQTWGLNFYREVRRDRYQYCWNLISNTIQNEATQAGVLEGIENIKTPTRLFFIPYSSFYLNTKKGESSVNEFKAGMDIKYGINDAFTLDAILVPDFGQTKFDNVELNLSAFEQIFAEQRPFFTEGTDLFSKGDLFYSRRIGSEPSTYPDTTSDEEVINYPNTVNLLNALKISGRTKSGLGIGVLNAITEKTNAIVRKNTINPDNSETISERDVVVEPLANYNVLVLDQRFNKNSSVSLVNTNVTRNGEYRDANVSALVWDLNTKKNTFNLEGDFKYSYVNELSDLEDRKGYVSSLSFGKTSGKRRFRIGGNYVSNEFDNNDLGVNFQTHYHSLYGNTSYRILKPNELFNEFSTYLNLYSEYDNRTGRLQAGSANLQFNITNKKNDYISFAVNTVPLKTYDFYEPRSFDEKRFVEIPEQIHFSFLFSGNYNRRFALDFNPSFTFVNELERVNYVFSIGPRYRFNDKFSINANFRFVRQNKNTGWAAFDEFDNTIFARRDRKSITSTLSAKYSINNKMNFNLNVRHYWSSLNVLEYLTLLDNGTFEKNTTYSENKNQNLDTWNLDLAYSWWFAPGSQISILYRNNSYLFTRNNSQTFSENLNESLDSKNLNHVFSISIRYFIDYNSLKK